MHERKKDWLIVSLSVYVLSYVCFCCYSTTTKSALWILHFPFSSSAHFFFFLVSLLIISMFCYVIQKYRLHTRRPSPSPQAAAAAAPQLVVLGGIWVPSEYATAAAAAAHHGGAPPTLYGAHHSSSPHHYCATPVPQEFYPTTAPPQPLPQTQATAAHHHHHHHHQLHHHSLHNQLHHHVYHPASQTTVHSSPESDIRGGTAAGDRSESIEDGKSESSSWKADDSNGENGGERKILALRGEDGEESNGSEITLKF